MTTPEHEQLYEAQHIAKMKDKGYVTHNPHNKPVHQLPVIYGFNNGGQPRWMHACLIAEDGTPLGDWVCSSEAFMSNDLGIIEGSSSHWRETFHRHYPDGYRTEFVGIEEVPNHEGLNTALQLMKEKKNEIHDNLRC